jgi:hypothetical protein
MRLVSAVLLFALTACGSGGAARDAETDRPAADAETDSGVSDAPDAGTSCVPSGDIVCTTGPRGAVITSFGAGDCFAAETTGSVWQVPETPSVAAHALFCGDIAAVLGAEGTLDYQACGGPTAVATPRCQQSGGGTGSPPVRYEWYFTCTLPSAGVCATTIRFVEHGLTD